MCFESHILSLQRVWYFIFSLVSSNADWFCVIKWMEFLEGDELAPLKQTKKKPKTMSPVGQDLEVRANGERISTSSCFLYLLQVHILQGEDIICPGLHEVFIYLLREVHSLWQVHQVLLNEGSVSLQIKSVFLKNNNKKMSFLIGRWTNGSWAKQQICATLLSLVT